MTIPGTVLVFAMGGILTVFILAGAAMSVVEKRNSGSRAH